MKILSIELENFWGFEHFGARLDPDFNLVVGDNGYGKTAFLEGLAVGLGSFFLGTDGAVPTNGIDGADIRCEVHEFQGLPTVEYRYPSTVRCSGQIEGQTLTWSRSLNAKHGRTTRQDASQLSKKARQICQEIREGASRPLPVLAYYGTRRLWRLKKDREKLARHLGSRFDGYEDCLDPASNHKQLTEWMRQQAGVALQSGKTVPHVAAVEEAVVSCIGGAKGFYYNHRFLELRVQLQDGRELPFELLSDGYRNMIAMVADIAWRAAVLNPHFGDAAARKSTGVVLIDEIDLHLHPAWQRSVIANLRRSFPGIQFVATTHSPQVISSARREWILSLKGGLDSPAGVGFVEGKDSNSILAGEMGVPERPEEMKSALTEVFDLIDRGDFPKATKKVGELEKKLGMDDSELVRARWLLEAEESGPDDEPPAGSPRGRS